MLDALMSEAFETGQMNYESPDFETTGEMVHHLIGVLYIAGRDARAEFYRKVFGL